MLSKFLKLFQSFGQKYLLDLAFCFLPHFKKSKLLWYFFPQLQTQLKRVASYFSSPDQDNESVAWISSQVLNTHYITLYVSFIFKYKKTKKRPGEELVQGRPVFWIERNFADWYQLTIWPNMLTKE